MNNLFSLQQEEKEKYTITNNNNLVFSISGK